MCLQKRDAVGGCLREGLQLCQIVLQEVELHHSVADACGGVVLIEGLLRLNGEGVGKHKGCVLPEGFALQRARIGVQDVERAVLVEFPGAQVEGNIMPVIAAAQWGI